jgi:hypothetical protein
MHHLREHSYHPEFNVNCPKVSLIDSWLWFHLFLNYLCIVALLNLKVSDAARYWCNFTVQLGTPRGRYDEHNTKFSLSKKPRFIEYIKKPNSRRWCLLA